MGGGFLQLTAYGSQDVYLTGNPQITFFKAVYKRHTNFAMEAVEQTFSGNGGFGKKVTCTLSRIGDLIHRLYVMVELPSVDASRPGQVFRWLPFIGEQLIESVLLEIGGQKIDKHYGEWLHIWNELSLTDNKRVAYNEMIGHVPRLNQPTSPSGSSLYCNASECEPAPNVRSGTEEALSCTPGQTLYIPLQFWFNRNPGLALPLIALQYHEVKLTIQFAPLDKVCYRGVDSSAAGFEEGTNVPSVRNFKRGLILAEYIFLDSEERKKFADMEHEYLIEQVQQSGSESTSNPSTTLRLNFNHPVKELLWVVQRDDFVTCGTSLEREYKGIQPFNYGLEWQPSTPNTFLPTIGPLREASLLLNSHERFEVQPASYFNVMQPYEHHTASPSAGIYMYSFALKPEEHQPSGTCNMSRIDTTDLKLELYDQTFVSKEDSSQAVPAQVRVYAINYNVLRIMKGMGGLAYSN